MAADASVTPSEIHRYFPEWADLPAGPDSLREADRNSYLAGGYADEFGYGRQSDGPAASPPFQGDPEGSGLWCEQIGALHPGYPQCPTPLGRMREPDGHPLRLGRARDRDSGKSAVQPYRARPHTADTGYRVIPVRPRDQAALRRILFRIGLLAFMAERLMRRRHLNDVL
jgi:hypothetical protein